MKVHNIKTRCVLTRKIIAESSLWSKNSKLKKECWWYVVPGWEKSPTSKNCSSYICLKNIVGHSFRLEEDSWKLHLTKAWSLNFYSGTVPVDCLSFVTTILPRNLADETTKRERKQGVFHHDLRSRKKNKRKIPALFITTMLPQWKKTFETTPIIYNTNI